MPSIYGRGWLAIGLVAAIAAAVILLTGAAGTSFGQTPEPTATPAAFEPPPECASEDYTRGELLAFRLLSVAEGPPVLDENEWQSLAAEIDGILSRTFEESSDVPEVPVRRTFLQGRISIELHPAIAQLLDPMIWEASYWPPTKLNDAAIDSLNDQLGFRAIIFPFSTSSAYWMTLCLDPLLNVKAALDAYLHLDSVLQVAVDALAGDGSDIAVHKQNGVWYVVLREAFGDCPSGCIGQDLYYFAVTDSEVTQLCEDEAWENPVLLELAETWGPQRLPTEPRTCEEPQELPKTGGHP